MDKYALRIIEILEEDGHEARIAGGAVRDFLLGITPKDIDIATTARPVQVIQSFVERGYDVIETGLQHGTVTVMMAEEGYEVTTLRIDKETDGRHAEVEFTDDWRLDAARRDFTINAMFMDKHGVVHDFFDGEIDLAHKRVRFVGNAEDRIIEDYLRIMRYFRFKARLNPGVMDDWTTLQTIKRLSGGLEKISGERIWVELKKILDTPDCFATVQSMIPNIGNALRIPYDGSRVPHHFKNGVHPLMKLIALYNFDAGVITVMRERFKASYNEIEFVKTYFMLRDSRTTPYDVMKYAERRKENFDAILDVIRDDGSPRAVELKDFFSRNGWFALPEWPVNANDLIEEGFAPGKELGKELEARRKKYLDSYFIWSNSDR